MNQETRHKLRALVLATAMTVSVVGGGAAFIGGVTAAEYGLTTTDGAGGESSFLFTNTSGQLPEGAASGDDQLTLKANDSLPETFDLTLTLDQSSDVTFNASQDPDSVNVEVFSTGGSPQDGSNSSVTSISEKTVEIKAKYKVGNGPRAGVNITGLQFDTGARENTTLTWEVRGDKANYTLEVDTLPTTLEAIDDQNGDGADITAGSKDQQMIGVTSGTSPRLDAADPTEFPSRFTATLDTADAGITFNTTDNSSVSATSPFGSATVSNVNSSQIEVEVTNFDASSGSDGDNYIVQLDGVRYDVTPDAADQNITWNTLGKSAGYELFPERLDAEFAGSTEFARGATKQPDNGVGMVINATDKRTDGLHAGGDNMTVTIPTAVAGLSFDKTADVSGEVDTGDDNPLTDNPQITNVTVKNESIEFTVPTTVDSGEEVILNGLRFNTSDFDERTATSNVSIDSELNVSYSPVNATGAVGIATANKNVTARAPNVTATGPSRISTNASAENTSVTVNITDTVGGQVANGSDITIEIEGSDNVTFNQSQNIAVDAPGDQAFFADAGAATITDRKITLPVKENGDSKQGDWLNISSQSGGLTFDTTNLSTNVTLAVTTTAASDGTGNNVTQLTNDVVTPCQLVQSVISDDQGKIGNANISRAIDLWREDKIVPETCGKKISNSQISNLIDIWREDGTVDEP